jgi:hypothetical protein
MLANTTRSGRFGDQPRTPVNGNLFVGVKDPPHCCMSKGLSTPQRQPTPPVRRSTLSPVEVNPLRTAREHGRRRGVEHIAGCLVGFVCPRGRTPANIMSSPGSGRTRELAVTGRTPRRDRGRHHGRRRHHRLEAAKLAGRGAQVSLRNTSNGFGGECHFGAFLGLDTCANHQVNCSAGVSRFRQRSLTGFWRVHQDKSHGRPIVSAIFVAASLKFSLLSRLTSRTRAHNGAQGRRQCFRWAPRVMMRRYC